jgi:hypothetical protein
MRSVLAAAAVTTVVTAALVAPGTAAFAATPGFEPDANAIGTVAFYDASGNPITGGSLSSHPMAAYAVASGPGRTGDTKATLLLATPVQGVLPPNWSSDTMTASTTYPNTTAPANIAAMTVPVASGAAGDLSFSDYISEFPNNSAVTGYAGLYEVRLLTSGPGQAAGPNYYRVDVSVNTAAGTWSVAFPTPVTSTTTTLDPASPASPANHGTMVTLTAHVAPANVAGSVHFFDGATDLGAASYTQATGTATFSYVPADGAHSFQAKFTSGDSGFSDSASATQAYTVNPPGTPTTIDLGANPPSPAIAPTSANTVSVTLTSHVTPLNTAGSVHFFDGATDLGAADVYTPATGVATKVVTIAVAGSPHLLTASFAPSSTGFQSSTSAIYSYTVAPFGSNTSSIPLQATDNTPPYAGALSLQVAAGTSVNLTQIDPNTAAGHPVQATDPTGHRHAWVFTGTLTGVGVNDTRPTEPGWTLSGQASDFVNGGTTISAKNLGWTPGKVAAGSDAEGTVTLGSIIDSILKTATSNGLFPPGGTLASAAAGNGLGTQNLQAGLELRIPDTSPTGTYSSTLTLTLVSP